ncbi:MAG TPA: alpha/beta hydrolase [Solirubrobacteraceae bacterium]|nr:alpha/beta hydrolase [Solirubrobacteraceae bacterium]
MLRVVKGAALATASAAAGLMIAAASAQAAVSPVAFTPCTSASASGFACAQLTVPLDPSGAVPGTVTLSIERKVAVTGTATQAVVALVGGPGQAAIPLAEGLEQIVSSGLPTRDLIVFDQRGTGTSGALSCPAFESPGASLTPTVIGNCGTQLGTARGFYESDDSVADIEAIRQALGYSQVILYGTSYGTKVALRYAEQHPTDTAGLVLDSTVAPNGPDVYGGSSFAAIPKILANLCARDACRGIDADPSGDLATLVSGLSSKPVRSKVITAKGHVAHVMITPDAVFGVLISGDLDPILRANLPAALHAAVHGDYSLLAMLVYLASAPEGGVNDELYLATSCEEQPFPWNRADSPTQRATEALAAFQAQPASTFAPFTAQTGYDFSDAPYCAGWPFETAGPEPSAGTLPNVPALIISGAEDMRTPTADAQSVATQIPDATLLVVPNTGHSVLGTEPTNCAQDAVNAFFKGTPIAQCTDTAIPSTLVPTPVPPRSLRKLKPAPGTHGRAGKTVRAVLDTLSQSLGVGTENFLNGSSPSATVRFGGLRAGWGSFSLDGLHLHDYSYLPGITVSGSYATRSKTYTLTIGGPKAADGDLVFHTKRKTVSGRLGGVAVHTTDKKLDTQSYAIRASTAQIAGHTFASRLAGL